MIESVEIRDEATFVGTHFFNDLKLFNYVYGANHVGKTTLSRILAQPDAFPKCKLKWQNGAPLDVFVYNRDFVNMNFGASSELKGIYTIGEQNVELMKRIAKTKEDRDGIDK